MIIAEQLVQKVDGLRTDESLILRIDEGVPILPRKSPQDVIILRIEFDIVTIEIFKQVICAQHFRDLNQLVRIAVAMEEGLFAEDHGCKHGAQRPHVQRVVVFLEIYQEFGAFEVARGDADIVFGACVIEFCETPIYQT